MAACGIVSWTAPPTSVFNGTFCSRTTTGTSALFVAKGRRSLVHPRAKACRDGLQSRRALSIWIGSSQKKLSQGAPTAPFSSLPQASDVARHLKIIAAAAASSSSGQSTKAPPSEGEGEEGEQREKLKEKLLAAVEAANGNLNEECVSIIAELQKVNPNEGVLVDEKSRKLWLGYFGIIRASFKGSGRKGEGKADVGYKGAPATLGRLSFNGFKPAALDVLFQDTFNEVSEEGAYELIINFTFAHPRGPDLPAVEGLIFNRGSYSNASPDRQDVLFHTAVLRPRFPEKDLEVWREVFAENAGMDEGGQVITTLRGHKGTLDYLYIDDEIRITRGNYGAHVLVRKLLELEPEFRPSSLKKSSLVV